MLLSFPALAARVEVSPPPDPAHADTEAVTNVSFGAGVAGDNVFALALAPSVFAKLAPIAQYSDNPEAALAFIATATNHWGNDAASAKSVFEGVYGALRFALADCDQNAMCTLFRVWADEQIPPTADRDGTNLWIDVKCYGIRALIGSRAVCNDTNCWMAAAREHGRISLIDRHKWYEFLGVDNSLIEEQADGTVVINAPVEKRAALRGRPWMTIGTNGVTYVNAPPGAGLEPDCNESAREFKNGIWRSKHHVGHALGVFASSDTFVGMDAMTRNAIVSNIVIAALLTPTEAAAIGLTNVVEVIPGN